MSQLLGEDSLRFGLQCCRFCRLKPQVSEHVAADRGTSYRSIRRRKKEEPAMARNMCLMTNGDDGYETVQVPERKLATFGVDIAKLEEWIEEDSTGQKRLPGVG